MSDVEGRHFAVESVLRAARRGDREGFERLMVMHRDFLFQTVERDMDERLRSVLDPDDVVQDVMLAAYRSITATDLPSTAAFRRWLEALSRDCLRDLRRRHFGASRRAEGKGERGTRVEECVSPYGPPGIATRREVAEALEGVLSRIPASYREIIRLVEVEHLPMAEVAARVGERPEAVGRTLERALRACREEMVRTGTFSRSPEENR